jgi:hypothetical protein
MRESIIDEKAIDTAAYPLRRKEAWARLAGYFAFALGWR